LNKQGFASKDIGEAVMLLASQGKLAAANDAEVIGKVVKKTLRLNAHLIGAAAFNGKTGNLGSPVTGGGIALGRAEQLFLLALCARQGAPR
jgi:hypothetical protein